jgi:hypothetical protein
MARVLVATQPWGVLWEKETDRSLKVPVAGVLASINATVYVASSGGTVVDPAAFVTNADGELPGFVDEGAWSLTVGADVFPVAALGGTLPARADAASAAGAGASAAVAALAVRTDSLESSDTDQDAAILALQEAGGPAARVVASSTPGASDTLDLLGDPLVWKTYDLSLAAATVTLANVAAGSTVVLRVIQPAAGGCAFSLSDGTFTSALDIATGAYAVTDVLVKCFAPSDLLVTIVGTGVRLPTTITAPAASVTFSAPSPTLVVPRTISAVPATSTFSAPAPVISGPVTITAVPATVTFSAPAPGVGTPFDPLTLSPLMWFKPESLSALSDGAAVTSWPDSSGNGRNAVQATGANQPLYKTAIVNGQPVVRFDGSNDSLVGPTVTQAQPVTIIACGKFRGPRAGNDPLFATDTNALNLFWSNTNELSLFTGSAVACALTVPTITATFHTFSAIFNGASSELRADGGTASTGSPGTIAFAGNKLQLASGGGAFAAVDIAEVLVFPAALSTVNRQNVESYLRAKYATA